MSLGGFGTHHHRAPPDLHLARSSTTAPPRRWTMPHHQISPQLSRSPSSSLSSVTQQRTPPNPEVSLSSPPIEQPPPAPISAATHHHHCGSIWISTDPLSLSLARDNITTKPTSLSHLRALFGSEPPTARYRLIDG